MRILKADGRLVTHTVKCDGYVSAVVPVCDLEPGDLFIGAFPVPDCGSLLNNCGTDECFYESHIERKTDPFGVEEME